MISDQVCLRPLRRQAAERGLGSGMGLPVEGSVLLSLAKRYGGALKESRCGRV